FLFFFFFFFQAEDGIRDFHVTGVQTCALPIFDFRDTESLSSIAVQMRDLGFAGVLCIHPVQVQVVNAAYAPSDSERDWARRVVRSEERRVGKECRCRWGE